jgi:sugar phosphate isomerase/epimerase
MKNPDCRPARILFHPASRRIVQITREMNMTPDKGKELSRRDFIKVGAAGTLAAAAGCEMLGLKSKRIPIGLQLYAVRDQCAKDLAGTVKQVAELGYEGVEFAGYYDWSAKDLKKLLDDNGLKCCGTHTGLDTLLSDELEKTVAFHQTLENRFLIVPGLPGNRRDSAQAWLDTAHLFNEIAGKLKPFGMYCGYHNHAVEFESMDGKIPWDIFFGNTVEDVVMQLDVGNGMHGGADPVAILKKYPGRARTVHTKPYSKTNDTAVIGRDDAPWPEIITLCKTIGGTEWYIVEQEKYEKSSLDSVAGCIAGLKRFGA